MFARKTSDASQHEINWGNFDQIAKMHETGRLQNLKLNEVKKNDVIRSINKYSREILSIMYINFSSQISSVRPDPNSLKTKQALVNALVKLILSNIGGVQRDDAAETDWDFQSKSKYSKAQSIAALLILKQGGFVDSVEIKKSQRKRMQLCISSMTKRIYNWLLS